MKRRFYMLFVSAMLAFSLVGCGVKTKDASADAAAMQAEIDALKAENEALKNDEKPVAKESETDSKVETPEKNVEEQPTNSTALYGTKTASSITMDGDIITRLYYCDGVVENTDNGFKITQRNDKLSEDKVYWFDKYGEVYQIQHISYNAEHPDGKLGQTDYVVSAGPVALSIPGAGIGSTVECNEFGKPVTLTLNGKVIAYFEYDGAGRLIYAMKGIDIDVSNKECMQHNGNKVYCVEYTDDSINIIQYRLMCDYYDKEARETIPYYKYMDEALAAKIENGKVISVAETYYPAGNPREDTEDYELIYNEYGFLSDVVYENNKSVKFSYEYNN